MSDTRPDRPGDRLGRHHQTTRTTGQIAAGGAAGLVIGFAGGAALGGAIPGVSPPAGGIIGGVVMAAVSAWADANRRPGRVQPLWVRVLASTFFAATIGWALESVLPDVPLLVVGLLVGVIAGAIGARARKVVLGLTVGAVVGVLFDEVAPDVGWALVAAITMAAYRSIGGVIYQGREQVRFVAEDTPAEELAFVVPLVEHQGYVGVDYLRRYADRVGASFARSPTDIGIIDSVELLDGPSFDPGRLHSLIKEFYEHTSRFHLDIVPRWQPWMRLPYRVYRNTVAKPLGQANAPFNLEEVQSGLVSWIDTIDIDRDGIPDFRAWVRAYEGSLEPLYVGIYTVVREAGVGYVSVGFPLPAGSFTATLLPSNQRGDGLLLSSRQGDFQGHYLSLVDPATGRFTVAKLTSFDEEIDVRVEDGILLTDHRFFLGGIEFMSLHYTMTRI